MRLIDLIKATAACGGTGYLVCAFPAVSQAMLIGLLALIWLLYAQRAVQSLRRR